MKRQKIQFAALPYRLRGDGRIEVLLITSRDTGRWIVPKGWPMKGKKPFDAAAQEAWEEAGVLGRIARKALGQYEYQKASADRSSFTRLKVKVFALEVEMIDTAWPEYGQRLRRWHEPDVAAALVDEKALSTLIRRFGQRHAEISGDENQSPDVQSPPAF